MEITALISLLRSNGVKKFKDKDFEIEFERDLSPVMEQLKSQLQDVPEPKDMPPELKADRALDFDNVLNWSTPPSPDDSPLPLTGEP